LEVAEVDMAEASAAQDGLVLVLNSGSSSLKFGLYRRGASDEDPILFGSADGIGRDDGSLQIRSSDGTTLVRRDGIQESQGDAVRALAAAMREHAGSVPAAVGHRVVHGGPRLCSHQVITPAVLEQLRSAVHFAPLHIPQALSLMAAAQAIFPAATQFACFDTTFHQTIPEVAAHLPLPQRYFEAGVRRYGFHGISYESLVHHFAAKLPSRAIFAHLGNGSSLCAVRDGKSIDTTMGLTPTGGIPMGTRSGDLDPGVVLYLLRNEKLDADALEDLLNHQSGLFAFSPGEGDVKALQERVRANDPGARLALDAFAVAVRKTIGAYVALLGGVDLLVFTGGIGEHSSQIRSAATDGLDVLGLTPDKIQILATEEERQIARHCRQMMMANRA
jgi:acetate kinase